MSRPHRQTPEQVRISESSGDTRIVIEAAASTEGETPALKTFRMVAYTGGKLWLMGFYAPVVVDLAGMKIPSQTLPSLRDHDPGKIIGHTNEITVQANKLRVVGVISAENEHSTDVLTTSRNGFPWQASITAAASEMQYIDLGESAEVNGKKFSGPLYVARKSVLKELSFVALGADEQGATARVAAAARNQGGQAMEFEVWLQARGYDAPSDDQQREMLRGLYQWDVDHGTLPVIKATGGNPAPAPAPSPAPALVDLVAELRISAAAELERQAAISQVCGDHVTIRAQAIRENWTRERAELEVLRASRPRLPATSFGASELFAERGQVIQAALLQAGRYSGADKAFPDQVLQAAHTQFRGAITLKQLLLEAAWNGGWDGRHFPTGAAGMRPLLQAAFSTHSLDGILSNTANKFLLDGFNTTEQSWRRIAAIKPCNDFKTNTFYRMTLGGRFEKIGPTGELKHHKPSEESYTAKAGSYGRVLVVPREDIVNDDLGAITDSPKQMARQAGLGLNHEFWTAYLDNSTFFTSGRLNYFEGAATNLQVSSLKTAEQMYLDLKDSDNNPLGIQPKLILVPSALKTTAAELYQSITVNTGGASTKDQVPNKNVFAGLFEPVASSYLGNSAYTGYSSTAWYLLADPMDLATMVVLFLNGQQEPTIETVEPDFDVLGIAMRGYYDFGVAKAEYRGGVKSKGAA